jgi:hypothetical protein
MARYTPTVAEAEGMREGILAQRRAQGLTQGIGSHPYGALDFSNPADRRIVGSVYAMMAREAMPR